MCDHATSYPPIYIQAKKAYPANQPGFVEIVMLLT